MQNNNNNNNNNNNKVIINYKYFKITLFIPQAIWTFLNVLYTGRLVSLQGWQQCTSVQLVWGWEKRGSLYSEEGHSQWRRVAGKWRVHHQGAKWQQTEQIRLRFHFRNVYLKKFHRGFIRWRIYWAYYWRHDRWIIARGKMEQASIDMMTTKMLNCKVNRVTWSWPH